MNKTEKQIDQLVGFYQINPSVKRVKDQVLEQLYIKTRLDWSDLVFKRVREPSVILIGRQARRIVGDQVRDILER